MCTHKCVEGYALHRMSPASRTCMCSKVRTISFKMHFFDKFLVGLRLDAKSKSKMSKGDKGWTKKEKIGHSTVRAHIGRKKGSGSKLQMSLSHWVA